jgi:hypothetical protein
MLQDMKVCGYNVLPIVTDCLNLYKYGLVRHGSALAGCCIPRRGLAGADNSRLNILTSVPSSVRHGRASLGTVRRGGVRLGKERRGMELETVDRVLATVPLRVLCGEAGQSAACYGKAWSSEARLGEG